MRLKLEKITKWLRDSGLKVNESKTEMCLFHRKDCPPINIIFNNQVLTSKSQMNFLGVTFDSKLNWQTHIKNTIANKKSISCNLLNSQILYKIRTPTSNYF